MKQPSGSKNAMRARKKSEPKAEKVVVVRKLDSIKTAKLKQNCVQTKKKKQTKKGKGKRKGNEPMEIKKRGYLSSASLTSENGEKKVRKMYKKNFEGNEDETGSIDSAALDEDICYTCGVSTENEDEDCWDQLIICDRCNGEYHLKCVNLELAPEDSWTCCNCFEELKGFKGLKYLIDKKRFPIPRKRKGHGKVQELCYSPSRPLDEAWEECKLKGFMCVSKVFSYDIMRKLTHGPLSRQTKSGRVAEHWPGALREIERRINNSCNNIINREGRYDLRLPDYVVEILNINEILKPILEKLGTIMVFSLFTFVCPLINLTVNCIFPLSNGHRVYRYRKYELTMWYLCLQEHQRRLFLVGIHARLISLFLTHFYIFVSGMAC